MSQPSKLPENALEDVRVFVVDDEELLAWSIETELKAAGAEVLTAGSLRQALERFPMFNADLAVIDVRLPDGNGLELLKKWRNENAELPVILITAHGAIDSAVTALRLGAFDYLQKPFDMKSLLASIKRAADMAKLRQKVSRLEGSETRLKRVEIIGDAPQTLAMKERLERVARSKADTVLIMGESGTGKELAAQALHAWSSRAKEPFIEINCASIPENLLESELFGYEKGAFTDARDRKLGLFEMARAGTIFLDEIGEMPLKLQTKLLRALEYRRFKRLGGVKDIAFGARIVAATNRRLIDEVQAGRFRGDLYYRLSALPITIPALRERRGDIGTLARFFLGGLARDLDLAARELSHAALIKLEQHDWPGNVRELRNVLQRALIFHEPQVLEPCHIEIEAPVGPRRLADADELEPKTAHAEPNAHDDSVVARLPEREAEQSVFLLPDTGIRLDAIEKDLILQALERARNNQTKAARLLGITRHTLRYRLEKHGLVAPQEASPP